MIRLGLGVVLLLTAACTNVSEVVMDMGGGRVHKMVVEANPSALSPQISLPLAGYCEGRQEVSAVTGLKEWKTWDCDLHELAPVTTPGWFVGFFQNMGVGVGMAYGLANMKPSTTNVNTNTNVSGGGASSTLSTGGVLSGNTLSVPAASPGKHGHH